MEFTYVVVTMEGAQEMSREELENNYKVDGFLVRKSAREELQGQPTIFDLCGPMYDGETKEGAARIRYETWDVYNMMSC